jgi:hypothetical protein
MEASHCQFVSDKRYNRTTGRNENNHQSKMNSLINTKSKKRIMNMKTQRPDAKGVLEFFASLKKKRCLHIGNIEHFKKSIKWWRNHLPTAYQTEK